MNLAIVSADEDRGEADDDTENADGVNWMVVSNAWEEDWDRLPDSHDDCEGDGAELLDGIEDEELSNRRSHRQDDDVTNECRMA